MLAEYIAKLKYIVDNSKEIKQIYHCDKAMVSVKYELYLHIKK
jgi:hypothetical protein